ncbi:hypothetical protein GCM10009678_17810 [Actinomadura kijaniata]
MVRDVVVWRSPDGIFLVSEPAGKALGTFYAENDRWWRVVWPSGRETRVWKPDGNTDDLVRRVVCGP